MSSLLAVPARAASIVPAATIVYLVRDPIDRIVSHWRHWTWRGYEKRALEDALRDRFDLYVAPSLYATQLKQWTDCFAADQVLVMHQNEVRSGAKRLLDRFGLGPATEVGVQANSSDAMRIERLQFVPEALRRRLPRRINSRTVPEPQVGDALRAQLLAHVGADVLAFEAETGIEVLKAEHRAALRT